MSNYYLIYVTANDDPQYAIDMLNLYNMVSLKSGVEFIYLYIVVSQARLFDQKDLAIIAALARIIKKSKTIILKKIILKGNNGRDFSSVECALNNISSSIQNEDWIMIRNRSGYGPLNSNWYKQYIDQYLLDKKSGLVGSTINLVGHPKSGHKINKLHVQTYVYLSRWKVLRYIKDQFPGANESNRLDIINKGEIGLSQLIMEQGYTISCLFWPNYIFSRDVKIENLNLPLYDIKRFATDVPIRYKFREYRKKYYLLLAAWKLKLLIFRIKNRRNYNRSEFEYNNSYGPISLVN